MIDSTVGRFAYSIYAGVDSIRAGDTQPAALVWPRNVKKGFNG